MKSITEIKNFEGKKVFVRTDWNIPDLEDTDRLDTSIPTIKYILDNGGKVVVASHLTEGGESLDPIIKFARSKYPILEDVEILENLRLNLGEEANSEEFARELASKADMYVNDAFSASHRSHASVVGVPKFLPSYAGLQFMEEYKHLAKALDPEHPFLFILGGAKFETKVPLVEKFLISADDIFIGGALAGEAFQNKVIANNPKVSFPVGDIAALDSNEETLEVLKSKIEKAKFILWNGPVGKYEDGYTEGTKRIAQMIADSGATSIVGGGDTLAAIRELGIKDKFTFVSLAGGAMLDFLADGNLVGIEALG